MARQMFTLLLVAVAVAAIVQVTWVSACPFCPTAATTLREDIDAMDAVVLARLVRVQKSDDDVPMAQFSITSVLKGKEVLGDERIVQTLFFGEPNKTATYLIMATDPPKLMWSKPLKLSGRAQTYIQVLMKMPKDAPNRLEFFQAYLEDRDEFIAHDAFDEFSRASYDEVKAHKSKMDREQLIAWIKSADVPASRRRLYFTMLGVCGSQGELPMLESMFRSTDRRQKAGLDAMIACYLTLKGPEGLAMIEDTFIKNKRSEYADTYSAIMALRFHGQQSDIIPRERVLESLRYMLDRPSLADLAIPDLAKWEDWSVASKLVALFKNADEKSSWVRLPVVNFLRACPLPEAAQYIKELEKIDPEAVERARTIFPKPTVGNAAGS